MMGDEESSHFRVFQPDAYAVTGDAWLGYFEERGSDAIAVADADLVVRKFVHGEVFSKLAVPEIVASEIIFPVAIGVQLVDHDGSLFAAVSSGIALTVAVDIEPPDDSTALHRFLPDAGVNGLAAPCDVARKSHIQGDERRHCVIFSIIAVWFIAPSFCLDPIVSRRN